MRNIFLISLLLLLIIVSFRSPQNLVARGNVKDEKGNPLTNVLVTEKGTNNYTSTDINGDFSIGVLNEKSLLHFSAKGFVSVVLKMSSNRSVNVVLKAGKSDAGKTDETENKLMYDRSAPLITSSNERVSSKIILREYAAAPANSLSGRIPGVQSNKEKNGYYSKGAKQEDRRADSNFNTEDYDAILENRFLTVSDNPLSTFSIDVDAAAYSNIRRYLQMGQLPPSGSVRIEEMINYFSYDYPQPLQDAPFSINTELAACPWNTNHQLVLVGLQGKKIATENLPPSNIVFLIDVSGSMNADNKLPLVKESMKLLIEQLREEDRISIVVYAGNAGLVLSSTSGGEKRKIMDAVDRLEAGGSTAGGEGIKLAYKTAKSNFIPKGNNRVILCTDGDFNIGASSDAALENMIEEERKSGVFLTVLGYGMGNYKDNKMQKLADKGNGNHAYIDGIGEAKKVLVNEFGGTLFTIAKDVKLQVEFNPSRVQAYRLIGYENRLLNKEDFNNDAKDAGELGSGHTVTALYELIPAGVKNEFDEKIDPLKYQQNSTPDNWVAKHSGEVMNIKFRYKKPDGNTSQMIAHAVTNSKAFLSKASVNFRFAAAVAEFGMLLRNSEFKQSASFENALQLAKDAKRIDAEGYRMEFVQLIKHAQTISMQQTKKDKVFLNVRKDYK